MPQDRKVRAVAGALLRAAMVAGAAVVAYLILGLLAGAAQADPGQSGSSSAPHSSLRGGLGGLVSTVTNVLSTSDNQVSRSGQVDGVRPGAASAGNLTGTRDGSSHRGGSGQAGTTGRVAAGQVATRHAAVVGTVAGPAEASRTPKSKAGRVGSHRPASGAGAAARIARSAVDRVTAKVVDRVPSRLAAPSRPDSPWPDSPWPDSPWPDSPWPDSPPDTSRPDRPVPDTLRALPGLLPVPPTSLLPTGAGPRVPAVRVPVLDRESVIVPVTGPIREVIATTTGLTRAVLNRPLPLLPRISGLVVTLPAVLPRLSESLLGLSDPLLHLTLPLPLLDLPGPVTGEVGGLLRPIVLPVTVLPAIEIPGIISIGGPAGGDAPEIPSSPATPSDSRDPPTLLQAAAKPKSASSFARSPYSSWLIRECVNGGAGRPASDTADQFDSGSGPGPGVPVRRPTVPDSATGGNLRGESGSSVVRPAFSGRSGWDPELACGYVVAPADAHHGGRCAEAPAAPG